MKLGFESKTVLVTGMSAQNGVQYSMLKLHRRLKGNRQVHCRGIVRFDPLDDFSR